MEMPLRGGMKRHHPFSVSVSTLDLIGYLDNENLVQNVPTKAKFFFKICTKPQNQNEAGGEGKEDGRSK